MRPPCELRTVMDYSGQHGYKGQFIKSSFWFLCKTHMIECSVFPDGNVICPVTGDTLLFEQGTCPGCGQPPGECEGRASCYEAALGSPEDYR